MFDAFLRTRRGAVQALRSGRGLRHLRRRQNRGPTGRARSYDRGTSICPRDRPTTNRAPRRSTGWATARTTGAEAAHDDGVQVYDGLGPLPQGRPAAGLHRAVVSSSANCARCWRSAGIADLFEVRVDGVTSPRSTCRASPPRTRSWPPPRAGRGARRRPRCSRTRWPGCRRAAGHFGFVVGRRPGRAGRRAARARRRHRRDRPGRPARTRAIATATHDRHVPRGRAVEPARDRALDLDVLAQSESVFALGNGHIGWRGNLDEGEPHGLPGSYLNGVYESRPLPYAEAGYGYPEAGQTVINVTNGKVIRLLVDDSPFDLRYGAGPGPRARARLPRRRCCTAQRPVGVPGRQHGAGPLDPAGVADPAGDRRDLLRGRGRRRAEMRVVVQSELVANEALPEQRPATPGPRPS